MVGPPPTLKDKEPIPKVQRRPPTFQVNSKFHPIPTLHITKIPPVYFSLASPCHFNFSYTRPSSPPNNKVLKSIIKIPNFSALSSNQSNQISPIITVASSGQQSLSRRKPTSSSLSSSSSKSQPVATRIVYRETLIPFWQQNWFIALLFIMALAFFGLSIFLFLNLDLDGASFSSASASSSAASDSASEITYGSVIKLMHEKTKFRLHSHDVPYGSGSGQQSVTGFPSVDDANSYWIVRPQLVTSAKQGDTIKTGTIIRLQHMRTRKWLHSHLHASPISGNLEISCFGGENESDTGDYWRLIIEGSGKTWKQNQRIRLQHVDTNGYLHSHDKKYQRIAGGQQEVCGVREKRADNVWLAAEGVYLPVTGSK